MSPTSTQPAFAAAKAEPTVLTPQQYYELLDKLVTEGQGVAKVENVTAMKLPGMTIETLNRAGEYEAKANIELKKSYYVAFDRDLFPLANPEQVDAMIEMLGDNWSKKTIAINRAGENMDFTDMDEEAAKQAVEEEVAKLLGVADLSKAGIYVVNGAVFEDDYTAAAPGSTDYTPNPEGKKLALTMTEDIVLPVSWYPGATFDVKEGGIIIARQRGQKEGENEGQVPELIEALKAIKEKTKGPDGKKATPENTLYTAEGVPRFDVWGLDPEKAQGNEAKGIKASYGVTDIVADVQTGIDAVKELNKPKGGVMGLLQRTFGG